MTPPTTTTAATELPPTLRSFRGSANAQVLHVGPTVSLIYRKGWNDQRGGWSPGFVERVLTADPDGNNHTRSLLRRALSCGHIYVVKQAKGTDGKLPCGKLSGPVLAAMTADSNYIEASLPQMIRDSLARAQSASEAWEAWTSRCGELSTAARAAEARIITEAREYPKTVAAGSEHMAVTRLLAGVEALRKADRALAEHTSAEPVFQWGAVRAGKAPGEAVAADWRQALEKSLTYPARHG